MALLKMGGIVTQLSGKVGGQVFSNCRGGHYLKNIGSYSKEFTAGQSKFLGISGSLAQLWHTLTPEQQREWDDEAMTRPYTNRVGESVTLSGFNLFVQINGNRLWVGGTTNIAVPSPFFFDPVVGLDVVSSSNDITIIATSAQLSVYYQLYMTAPVSPGRRGRGLNHYLVDVLDRDTLEAGANVTANYRAVFGNVPAGRISHFYLDYISPGGLFMKRQNVGIVDFN